MQNNTSEPQNTALAETVPQESQPTPAEAGKQAKPKKKGGIKRFFGAIGGFFKKHKVLGVLLIVLIIIAALVLRSIAAVNAAVKAASQYSFVRTTSLTKGDLTSTVSCTGTVESANTSTVTYAIASTAALPKFKTVNVAVGDTVQAGDVIATLDTTDIEKSIQKAKENIADQVKAAQTTYNRAVENYNKAVDDYNKQKTVRDADLQVLVDARQALADFKASSVPAVDTTAQQAQAALDKTNLMTALAKDPLPTALTTVHATIVPPDSANSSDFTLYSTVLQGIITNNTDGAATSAQDALNALNTYEVSLAAYEQALASAQISDNTNSQDAAKLASLQQKEQVADTTYETSDKLLQQLSDQVNSAKNNVDDAKSALDKASDSDALEDLNDDLKNCSLKAETSGKVTALNASVGATPSGTIATIQDVDNLKVSVSINESDINSIQEGMSCQITTDATEGTIRGTLSQIDPVAGDSSKFGAEVTVDDASTGLKIGMNATVKIVLSNTADCFTVPIDAIGNDNDNKGDYVYRSTGGEGVNMTFEKVYVTTGASNDYYIEISSNDLAEGDIIRSSSDMTQGIVSMESESLMPDAGVTVSTDDGPGDGGPDGQGGGHGGPEGGQ
jgi:multidrug efflux pump subunit AcrA (membrane-fusion protein)